MLDHSQRSSRTVPFLIVLVLVGAGAYVLGDRHGRKVAATTAVVPAVAPVAAPAATPPATPMAAGSPTTLPAAPAAALAPTDGGAPVAAAPATADAGSAGPYTLAITVAGSLDEAIGAAVTTDDGPALTMVVSRLLVWWLRPARDARPGDKLWVVYDTPAGQEPLVIALRYESQKLGATRSAVRFKPADAPFARYYDETGTELEERLVDSPLDEYEQVTSLLRDGRGHKGVDFKVPVGTEVHSPVAGVVTRKNWKFHANGNCLGIEDSATHREFLYLHLSEVAPELKVGSVVKKGQAIAKTGNTGHTTAPHLHYQLMSPDQRVLDPFVVQATTRRKLSAPELLAFQKVLAELGPSLGGK